VTSGKISQTVRKEAFMSTPSSNFFMSYSREDAGLQKRVAAELRERGIKIWVDVENLIPGSPAWEREIERAIRSAAGIVVLLSPAANNSEWVRREISFAEDNRKRIFPVLIDGEEDDSIPLRLASHQRVDLRQDFNAGLDQLASALKEHLGVTAVHQLPKQNQPKMDSAIIKKAVLAGVLTLAGLACLGGAVLSAGYLYGSISRPTKSAIISTDTKVIDPVDLGSTETPTQVETEHPRPAGKIIYTCQIEGDEICLIKADGSGWQRLTQGSQASFNGSISPDGTSVVFVSGRNDQSEVYELQLGNGEIKQLTKLGRYVSTPEISPDNRHILFTYRAGNGNSQIWIMNRDGSNAREFYSQPGRDAHDATWSPDGTKILFAFGRGENNQLYIMDRSGGDPKLVNDTIDTRGHSSWSVDDLITFDMGGSFRHEIHVMNVDGSNLRRISEAGNNSQGESFSPDGDWIVFSAYTDVANKNTGSCELYMMRPDGSDVRRLTENQYCDYQPRWGN
jgi:TolB protein